MKQEMEALTKLLDTLVEFSVTYGFQILGALVFFVIGLKAAGWAGKQTARLAESKQIDITLAKFIGNIVKLVLIGFVAIITLGNFGITIGPPRGEHSRRVATAEGLPPPFSLVTSRLAATGGRGRGQRGKSKQ